MKGKKVTALALALLIALLGAVPALAQKEITFMHMFGQENIQSFFAEVIERYEAAYPDVKVNMQYATFDTINQQLSINVASGDLPDITFLNNPDFAAYVEMGAFADLTDYADQWEDLSQFYPAVLEAGTVDGRLYGFPFDTNCLALFYNKDMLEAKGVAVPTTMQELVEAAKALTDPDANTYGLIVAGMDSEETTFQFMPTLYSFGGRFDQVNGQAGIDALQMYVDLIDAGAMSREIIAMGQGDIRDRWIAGQAAMMYNGTWEVNTIKTGTYPDLDFNWDVALIPAGDNGSYSCMGGKIIGCGAGENVEESFNFIKMLCAKDSMLEFAKRVGAVPNRYDVAADPYWQEDAQIAVFVQQMETAVPRGPHENWPSISQAIRTAIGASLSGNSDVKTALDAAQKTIDSLL